MSLSALIRLGKASYQDVEDVNIILPPEYELSLEQWRTLIDQFNTTERLTKAAVVLEKFIFQHNPGIKDLTGLLTVTPIVEKDNQFFTTLSFSNNRVGATAFMLFKAEQLHLAAITDIQSKSGISHLVMTYIPNE